MDAIEKKHQSLKKVQVGNEIPKIRFLNKLDLESCKTMFGHLSFVTYFPLMAIFFYKSSNPCTQNTPS